MCRRRIRPRTVDQEIATLPINKKKPTIITHSLFFILYFPFSISPSNIDNNKVIMDATLPKTTVVNDKKDVIRVIEFHRIRQIKVDETKVYSKWISDDGSKNVKINEQL